MALPMMMTPHVFGEYSLAVTLFQYGLIFDCGAGQLADRWLPAAFARGQFEEADRLGQQLLWVRLYIGTILFVSAVIALTAFAALDRLPFGFWIGVLSAGAGILYMVALVPGFIYRALSRRPTTPWRSASCPWAWYLRALSACLRAGSPDPSPPWRCGISHSLFQGPRPHQHALSKNRVGTRKKHDHDAKGRDFGALFLTL